MKAFFTISFLLVHLFSQAQLSTVAVYKAVNDSIIARYNRNDFEGIYELGNEWFSVNIDSNYCIQRFKKSKEFTGEIVSSTLADDLGAVKHFTWIGRDQNLNFELRVEDARMKLFDFSKLVRQKNDPVKQVQTDNPLKCRLDSIVHKNVLVYMSDKRSAGLSIGIYKDGKKHLYNYGEANKKTGVLPDGNTIYQIGSVAKTFVGILLAKAIVEGKMHPDDDIRKYLKGSYPNLQYQGHPVKLVDLANHTGGFNRFNLINFPADFDNWSSHRQNEFFYGYSTARYMHDWHALQLDTMPGTNYSYSLGGIMLLRMALEKVYGRSLNELVKSYFGRSLKMFNTRLNVAAADTSRFAIPYNGKGEAMEPMLRSTESIFTIKSTPGDMLNYIEANVREKDLAILLSHKPTYGDVRWFAVGLTWMMTNSWDRGLRIFHSGHDLGYNTLCTIYPQSALGFVIMTNEDERQGYLFDLEKKIFQSLQVR